MLRVGQSVVWCSIYPTCAWWFICVRIKRMSPCYRCKNWRDLFYLSLCSWKKAAMLTLLLFVFRAKWDASRSLGQKSLSLWDWGELAGSLLQPWKGSGLWGTFLPFKMEIGITQFKCFSSPLLYLVPSFSAKIIHFFVRTSQEKIAFSRVQRKIACPHSF